MVEPKVTAVVANHGYGRWIEGCLDSAAASTHRPLQIAVMDDGSTDGSADIVHGFMTETNPYKDLDGVEGIEGLWKKTGVPILLIAGSPARGPSAARNVLMRAAWEWSDWFQILDADDEVYPQKISRLLSVADEDVGFVYGDYDNVDETGVSVRMYKEPFSRRALLRECIIHSGSLVSKKWLGVVGLMDENLRCVEDYDTWLRLSECSRGVHVAESLTKVRVGSHNSSSTVASATWQECWQRVSEKTQSRGVGLGRLKS